MLDARQRTMSARQVTCPSCQRSTEYSAANAFRPFCSQRCREADLGAWASEKFRLPEQAPSDEDGDEPASEPGLRH